MRVLLLNPDIASRSCDDCVKYLYYDKGRGQFGDRCERGGKPVLRPKGTGTPCGWCPKIAPGDAPRPENAQELSPKNLLAYLHYRECQAVGEFPADEIVRRNAGIIRAAEALAEKIERAKSGLMTLGSIMKGL